MSDWNSLSALVFSLVHELKWDFDCVLVSELYKNHNKGEEIPFWEVGYMSLYDFIASIPGILVTSEGKFRVSQLLALKAQTLHLVQLLGDREFTCADVNQLYSASHKGESVPFEKFRYKSLIKFLLSIPRIHQTSVGRFRLAVWDDLSSLHSDAFDVARNFPAFFTARQFSQSFRRKFNVNPPPFREFGFAGVSDFLHSVPGIQRSQGAATYYVDWESCDVDVKEEMLIEEPGISGLDTNGAQMLVVDDEGVEIPEKRIKIEVADFYEQPEEEIIIVDDLPPKVEVKTEDETVDEEEGEIAVDSFVTSILDEAERKGFNVKHIVQTMNAVIEARHGV